MNIGYKVLDMNMKSIYGDESFQYELNKIYYMNEDNIKICEYGFHYYKELKDIASLYSFNTSINKIFIAEVLGKEIRKGNKYCTNSIRIIRELNQEDINKYIEDNIKELVYDKNPNIRKEVAKQGYGLDILINDENWLVRAAIARQGYGLDILINDKDWFIRREVAKQGYGLDILVHDKEWIVRAEVARQGYGLDILINDEDQCVRLEVARRGYRLDILLHNLNLI